MPVGTFALTLAWCASASTNVTTYRLYTTDHSQDLRTNNVIGSLQFTVDNLVAGRPYFFYVTAVDTVNNLESDPSNELAYVIPTLQLMGPGVVRFNRPTNRANVSYILESTPTINPPAPWTTDDATETIITTIDGIETVEMHSNTPSPTRFYRVRLNVAPSGC